MYIYIYLLYIYTIYILYILYTYYIYIFLYTIYVYVYTTIQYNTIQYNTIQYKTIQYNTTQHNTTQHNTHILFVWLTKSSILVHAFSPIPQQKIHALLRFPRGIWKHQSSSQCEILKPWFLWGLLGGSQPKMRCWWVFF